MCIILRGSSHYPTQVKRPLLKLLSRGEGRNLLKYIMSVFLLDFEYFIQKRFGLSIRVWISILGMPKFLLRVQTLGAKSVKKYCHIGTLEAFYLWTLGTSVKAERPDSCSP